MQVFTVPSTAGSAGSEGPAVLTRDATRRSADATVSVTQQRRNLTVGNPGILVVVKGERLPSVTTSVSECRSSTRASTPITNMVFADRSGVSLETVGTSASPLSHTSTVTPTLPTQLDPTHAISLIYPLHADNSGSAVLTADVTG